MNLEKIMMVLTLTSFLIGTSYSRSHRSHQGICQNTFNYPNQDWKKDQAIKEPTVSYWKYENELSYTVKTINFSTWDMQKLNQALEIIKVVINSEEFKNRVKNFKWNGKLQYNQNNGLTNEEIFEKIMQGEEELVPGIDHVMNFDLKLYRSRNPFSKVYGYTNPDTTRVWLNKKFYRRSSYTAIDVASNLTHEWLHKIGFGHSFYSNPDRPYTVPYAVGYILGELAQEMGY